jgi:hypothetical protein
MFGKGFGKGSSVVFTCVVGVHYDARCSERLIKVPSTSESSVVRQALGNSIRREDEKTPTVEMFRHVGRMQTRVAG